MQSLNDNREVRPHAKRERTYTGRAINIALLKAGYVLHY